MIPVESRFPYLRMQLTRLFLLLAWRVCPLQHVDVGGEAHYAWQKAQRRALELKRGDAPAETGFKRKFDPSTAKLNAPATDKLGE